MNSLNEELKAILKHPQKQVTMSYFDSEDKKLLNRINESKKLSDSLSISKEKLHKCFNI